VTDSRVRSIALLGSVSFFIFYSSVSTVTPIAIASAISTVDPTRISAAAIASLFLFCRQDGNHNEKHEERG
jgi:hypothetical protein